MKTIINLLLILAITGCSQKLHDTKDEKINQTNYSELKDTTVAFTESINVRITMTHYYPYCGGAAPNESQMNNYFLLPNADFTLIDLNANTKTLVRTNAEGILELSLSPGHYGIQEVFKDCSFEEFMERVDRGSGSYVMESNEDCYKKWWQSLLGEFTIIDDEKQELNMGTSDRCFTGNNPCLIYTGPYPP